MLAGVKPLEQLDGAKQKQCKTEQITWSLAMTSTTTQQPGRGVCLSSRCAASPHALCGPTARGWASSCLRQGAHQPIPKTLAPNSVHRLYSLCSCRRCLPLLTNPTQPVQPVQLVRLQSCTARLHALAAVQAVQAAQAVWGWRAVAGTACSCTGCTCCAGRTGLGGQATMHGAALHMHVMASCHAALHTMGGTHGQPTHQH